ncbi:hypothetical protein [Streptomyces sp. NPDC058084]|uniref:hypothetical protein n=1 Tax=Streptomyces sp. NPDC058084 TaxID=3346333 RepID=UPI0036F0BFDF
MIVEPPDRRGLRRITINGRNMGSAWSLRELRKELRRLGYPDDMDLEDGSRIHWRGGDSGTWPDRRGRRHAVIVFMILGLLGSLVLHAVIGWADALGALTFAQRLVGVLFLLAGAVQAVAIPAVTDYWGRRNVKVSGALVLLGALIALATSSLLLFLWLQERELIPEAAGFLALWLWSLWALRILVRAKVWRGIPHPRKFAAGVAATALLTAVSLGYSLLYQPIAAPMHFILKAEFGKPQTESGLPYVHVPLTLYAKNDGGIPVYIVVDDYTVYGNSAKFSKSGEGLKQWKQADAFASAAELYATGFSGEVVESGQFQGPGTTLAVGEEFKMETVITLPKDTAYETLDAILQFAFLRQDRGKIDDEFTTPRLSWVKDEGRYYCPADKCGGEHVIYHGKVRYNDNLVNVTRKQRYVAAFWSPNEEPDVFVSSFNFKKKKKSESIYDIYEGLDQAEVDRENARYGVAWVSVNSQVSVHQLLKKSRS